MWECRYCEIEKKIFIHQENYNKKVIRKFEIKSPNPVDTPAEPGIESKEPSGKCSINYPFREAECSLCTLQW